MTQDRGELVLAVYVGETQAQAIAARLRRNEPIGAALSTLRPLYLESLRSLASPGGRRRLRIIGEVGEATSETVSESGESGGQAPPQNAISSGHDRGLAGESVARRGHRDAERDGRTLITTPNLASTTVMGSPSPSTRVDQPTASAA